MSAIVGIGIALGHAYVRSIGLGLWPGLLATAGLGALAGLVGALVAQMIKRW